MQAIHIAVFELNLPTKYGKYYETQ